MEWVPTASVEVAKVATWAPLTVLRVPVPMALVPSLKVTVPVGGFVPLVVTVAVNVTMSPLFAGFLLEVRVVVVAERVGGQLLTKLAAFTVPIPVAKSQPVAVP